MRRVVVGPVTCPIKNSATERLIPPLSKRCMALCCCLIARVCVLRAVPVRHQGQSSGRRGISNPHSPQGNRVSSAARPTVSGYLPVNSIFNAVDHRGVEPRSPGCKPGVVPLDQQPGFKKIQQRSARESNSVPLLTKKGCRRRTRGPSSFIPKSDRIVPEGVEPPFPLCKRGVVAIGPRDVKRISPRVARVGVEPTDIRFST